MNKIKLAMPITEYPIPNYLIKSLALKCNERFTMKCVEHRETLLHGSEFLLQGYSITSFFS